MEYNIANVLILFAIIYSVEADSSSIEEIKQTVLDSLSENLCPPFGKKAKFELETIHTMSQMFGCAYMGNESLQSTVAPLFHLWLERPELSYYEHGHCNNTLNMDHFMFECLSKHDRPTNKDETKIGWQYISLLEHTTESIQSKTKTRTYRCALYDVFDYDDRKIRRIRMVISKPVTGETFNVSQCNGLSYFLARDSLPIIPEGYRYWPDGSLYIYLLGRKANIFYTNTTTEKPEPPTTELHRTTTTSPPTTTTTISPPTITATISRLNTNTTVRYLTALIIFSPTKKNTTKNRPTTNTTIGRPKETITFSHPITNNTNSRPTTNITFSRPTTNTTNSLPTTTINFSNPKTNTTRVHPTITMTISYPTTNTTISRPTTNTTISSPTITTNTTTNINNSRLYYHINLLRH